MAKAIIKTNSGGGLYQVETVYDRDLVDSEIKLLPAKIESARQAYLDASIEADDLLAEIAPLKVQLAYDKAQLETNEEIYDEIWKGTVDADLSPAQLAEKNAIKSLIGQYENSISVLEKKISGLQSDYYDAFTKAQKHEANYYARLKRQDQLNDFPENPREALWCADYSTDIEIGTEVGTLDCAGYAKYNGRNIQPGFKENYKYDMARDGKLHHAFPGFNLTFSYLKFLTFNEGFQRWKPTTRYAVIVAWENQAIELEYWEVKPGDRLAYIRYLPAYSAWLKNSINKYPEDQHNVPIDYMECGDKAFKINDEILVEFQETDSDLTPNDGEKGWEKPLVIGFKDHPKPCPFYLYFIYDPILYYDEKGDPVDADSELRKSSARVFDVDEYVDNDLSEREPDKTVSIALPLNTNCIAGYNNTDSEHGSKSCNGHWSKTLYRTTVHALSWTVLDVGLLQWGVFIEHNGEAYTFKPSEVDRTQDTTLWPPETFQNTFQCSQYTSQGNYTPSKSFDVFALEEIWDDYSWDIGDIIVVMHGNKDSCEIWNISQDDYKFKSITIYSEIINDFPDEMNVEFRTVSLGVCKNIIYIAYAKMGQGEMLSFEEIYAYNLFTDSFSKLGESGDFCCYNPFLEEVSYFDFGGDAETTGVFMDSPYFVGLTQDNDICETGPVCNQWLYNGKMIGYDRMPPFAPSNCDPDCYPACYSSPDCMCTVYSAAWTAVISNGTRYTQLDGDSVRIEGGMCPNYKYYFFVWHWADPANCGDKVWNFRGYYHIDCPVSYHSSPVRQYGDYYQDWMISHTIDASITDNGTGVRIKAVVQNGVLASNIAVETNTLEKSDKDFDYGVIDHPFVSSKWPYVNPYAIAKNVTDSEGQNYDSIVAIKDKDNNIIFDGEDLGGYDMTGLFQFYVSNSEVFFSD